MADEKARRELSQALRQLVSGRITNDDYIDCWSGLEHRCSDRAVLELGGFGDALFSDTHTHRLRGRQRVQGETREQAARAVLFLRSDLEYEWPDWPESPWLARLFFYGLFSFVVASLVAWWTGELESGWYAWAAIVFFGPCLIANLIVLVRAWFGPRESRRFEQFKQAGDFDVWPFLRKGDFEQARRQHHLLAR